MSIQIQCNACGMNLRVPDEMAGKKGKCKCGQVLEIPGASTDQTARNSAATGARNAKSVISSVNTAESTRQTRLVGSSESSSFLDELTDNDHLHRKAPTPTPERSAMSDGAFLKAYVAKSADFKSETSTKARRKRSSASLRSIARLQKGVLVCILLNLLLCLTVVLAFFDLPFGVLIAISAASGLVFLVCLVFEIWLAIKLYRIGPGLGISLTFLLPVINILMLLVVVMHAGKLLRNNGVEVGFFGAKRGSIQ